MPELHLRIDRYLLGASARMGAVAEISRLDDPTWYDPDKSMVMVPAGEGVAPTIVTLPDGLYAVQIRMPSGRFVNRKVDLRTLSIEEVFVEAERSRNESLSWQSYVGDVPTELGMELREMRHNAQNTPQQSVPNLVIRAGATKSAGRFDRADRDWPGYGEAAQRPGDRNLRTNR